LARFLKISTGSLTLKITCKSHAMETSILKPVIKVDKKISHNGKGNHAQFPEAVDKVFKWTPLLSLIVLDAIGVKTRNDFKGHLLITGTGEAVMNAVLQPVKKSVDRVRPNHSHNVNSFPSGHTATSFLGAEILRQELKDQNRLLSYSGYVVAAATGALRVYNKKHWTSDVLVGAVLGILSAKVAYWLLKKMNAEVR
jgi:membrane-associated phospholipid phosphatase